MTCPVDHTCPEIDEALEELCDIKTTILQTYQQLGRLVDKLTTTEERINSLREANAQLRAWGEEQAYARLHNYFD